MYLFGSLFLALCLTVVAVSKIAEMLDAKKPQKPYTFLASLLSVIFGFIVLAASLALIKNIDSTVLIATSIFASFLVSSLVFKAINKLSWTGAITTNIANLAVLVLTITGALVLNGGSINEVTAKLKNNMRTATVSIEKLAYGTSNKDSIFGELSYTDNMQETLEPLDPVYTEADLLSKSASLQRKKEKEKRIVQKKFRVINLSNLNNVVGMNIRLQNNNNKQLLGTLKEVNNNELILEQRINNGIAVTPISLSRVVKVEVYQ